MGILNVLFINLTNSVMYNFSFLRNWSMKSCSATITCFSIASLALQGFLTPKGCTFYNKIYIYKMLFCINAKFGGLELQTWCFSKLILFIGCDNFLVTCLHLRKNRFLCKYLYQALTIKQKKIWNTQNYGRNNININKI